MGKDDNGTAVAEPQTKRRTKMQPRYNVLLHDDDKHSFQYVVMMMVAIFHKTQEDGYQVAKTVDSDGLAICLTTTMEHAELKRDQIHSYGADSLIADCKGSMSASIEPID